MEVKGKINSVSGPREFQNVMQVGFTLVTDTKVWYNIADEVDILEAYTDKILKRGAEISFEYDEKTKAVTKLKLIKEAEKGWEDDIVSFETLLTKAHSLKIPFSIKTKMLELNVEKKFALFKATVFVEGKKGEECLYYDGHGDATEENVKGDHIKPHFIRMAETRAIVRALRWYTNNGCAEEEK